MKTMKRLIVLMLALVMIFALAACGSGQKGNGDKKDGDQNVETTIDNPYNLDYTSEALQPMTAERASKDVLLDAKTYYLEGLQSDPATFSKMTYKDVAEHIGVDASEFQYFDSYKQYRYTWYVEGSEGPSLLIVFDALGNLYIVTASIS